VSDADREPNPLDFVVASREALPGVVELCRACYGVRAESPEWWRWRFFSGEPARSFVALARRKDTIVGMQPVRIDAFRRGALPLTGAALEGAMVHPAWRGAGVFTRLVSLALEEAWSRGASFAYTMPNEKSYPALARSGWSDLGERAVLVAPSWPMSRAQGDSDALVRVVSRFVGDGMGAPAADTGDLVAVHDAAWRAWRYANPEARYTLVEASAANGRAAGIAAGRVRSLGPLQVGVVMESGGEEPERRAALAKLRRLLRREGAVLCVAVVSASAQQHELARCGFRKLHPRLVPRRFRTVWRPRPGARAEDGPPVDGASWHLSLGDWDGL
jgi:GNAT superfamily N-acetyltransferase